MHRLLCCAAVLLFLAASLPVRALTLAEALAEAYRSNPQLEAVRARVRARDEELPEALAGRRPRLAVRSSVGWSHLENDRGAHDLAATGQSIDLVQPLYRGGRVGAATRRARAAIRAERERLRQAEQVVLLAAVEAYTAVVRDRQALTFARANAERLARQLGAARDRYRFGEVTRTDVAQAETRHARGMAETLAAEGELAVSVADFRRVVGDAPPGLEPAAKPADIPADEEEALALADRHPSVAAARFELDAVRHEIAAALAELKPQLTLNARLGYAEDPDATFAWQSDMGIGAVLTVPIYQGGAEYARVRERKQAMLERRYALEDARRAVRRDARAAWQTLAVATARIRAIERQVRAAELALEGVKEEALIGARTVLDVLDAEQELFEARIDLVRATREEILAAFALRAATGTLTAQALALPVEAYDPAEHHDRVRGKWFGLGARVEAGEDERGAEPR